MPPTSSVPRHTLLPNEPRIVDAERQQQLTQTYLQPFLAELEAFFLALRAEIDRQLAATLPLKMGKPYPLGQCLEITVALQALLKSFDPTLLQSSQAQAGHAAYLAFRRAGGSMRQVWGDLRGEFFQNAFQLGSLYLDVSNDTVTPTKPKVEILPFSQARFVAIRDFQHFSQIARRYWHVDVYPNHVLPELAPYLPLICRHPEGELILCEASTYMVFLTAAQKFAPSIDVLSAPAMPAALFERVRQAVGAQQGLVLATDPEQGRLQALQNCLRLGRKKGVGLSPLQYSQIIALSIHLNQRLAPQPVPDMAQTMPDLTEPVAPDGASLTLNGRSYALSTLPEEVQRQAQMLRITEQRLQELQRDMAVAQTARAVYWQALQVSLAPA